MSAIDTLIAQISDPRLRERLEQILADYRARRIDAAKQLELFAALEEVWPAPEAGRKVAPQVSLNLAGEALLAHENIDPNKLQTWVYLTGQRRVRKLPNACCDAPTPAAAGVMRSTKSS